MSDDLGFDDPVNGKVNREAAAERAARAKKRAEKKKKNRKNKKKVEIALGTVTHEEYREWGRLAHLLNLGTWELIKLSVRSYLDRIGLKKRTWTDHIPGPGYRSQAHVNHSWSFSDKQLNGPPAGWGIHREYNVLGRVCKTLDCELNRKWEKSRIKRVRTSHLTEAQQKEAREGRVLIREALQNAHDRHLATEKFLSVCPVCAGLLPGLAVSLDENDQ